MPVCVAGDPARHGVHADHGGDHGQRAVHVPDQDVGVHPEAHAAGGAHRHRQVSLHEGLPDARHGQGGVAVHELYVFSADLRQHDAGHHRREARQAQEGGLWAPPRQARNKLEACIYL
eukprot:667323-Pyramimonas_sp.AAC.2